MPDRSEQGRPYPRHAVDARQAAEGAMGCAPVNDAPRERRTHTREARDLRHVCVVQVDALTGQQGTREPGRDPRRLAQRPVSQGGGRVTDECDVPGRGLRRPRERKPDAGTRERETGEDQGGAAVVHNHNLGLTSSESDYQMTQWGAENRDQAMPRLDAQTHSGDQDRGTPNVALDTVP